MAIVEMQSSPKGNGMMISGGSEQCFDFWVILKNTKTGRIYMDNLPAVSLEGIKAIWETRINGYAGIGKAPWEVIRYFNEEESDAFSELHSDDPLVYAAFIDMLNDPSTDFQMLEIL